MTASSAGLASVASVPHGPTLPSSELLVVLEQLLHLALEAWSRLALRTHDLVAKEREGLLQSGAHQIGRMGLRI